MATFRCVCLQDVLDEIGLSGQIISGAGMMLYGQAADEGATFKAGANHRQYNVNDGIVYPRRLTCDHQGDAEIEFEVVTRYDGSNDPITESDSVSLPTAATDNESFTLGSATVGNVTIGQITRLEIDFGIMARSIGADSDIWDTHSSIRAIEPKITLTGTDIEWLKSTNIPRTGQVATHANSIIYLRKRSTGATGFVANGTSEHIKFTADGFAVIENVFDDQDDDPAEVSLELTCRYDGTNAPITVDTTSAIT
jgi:hypothetical protein